MRERERERERERAKTPLLHSAFTLVEMLIVVTIIAILTAIIPRVNGIMERARDLQRVNGLRTIATALEAYKATHGHYPLREPTDEEMKLIQES